MTDSTAPVFAPPGGGSWELEATHFTRPGTRFFGEVFPAPFARGFAEGTSRYGLMLSHFDARIVNGFLYQKAIVYAAPENAKGPPPKPIFFLLTRLHPGIRRRLRAGAAAFEGRLWREDMTRWQTEVKPAAIRAHLAIQGEDPKGLDDAALGKHLTTTRDHLDAMICQHHRFTIPCMVATGDFLANAGQWTEKSASELLGALKGSSPVSRGVAAAELDALAAAIREDSGARAILASDRPSSAVLEDLAKHEGTVGEAYRAYSGVVGYRSLGFDVCDNFALEMPDVLVRAISAAVAGSQGDKSDGASGERFTRLRESVPEAYRTRFDELLAEARHMNPLRDERGHYSDAWATGLARRAILEVGRRLAERGAIDEAALAVDAGHDELQSLLKGDRKVDSTELRRRASWRRLKSVADAPPFLGGEPSPPPPTEWLPEIGQRPQRATVAAIAQLFGMPPAKTTDRSVSGFPVSPGVYEGTARLIANEGDFSKLRQGDVLVTRSTSATFNVVLPLLGGIVTDRGGQLSHAAIVAREYGIPGVVGTTDATRVIPDGARVRVDGNLGEVRVIG